MAAACCSYAVSALGLTPTASRYGLAFAVDAAGLAAAVLTVITGAAGWFEWSLLFLLSRPMLAFTLVLASLRPLDR